MSTISINQDSLRSQVIRKLVGERTVDFFKAISTNEAVSDEPDDDGILKRIISIGMGLVRGLVGFAISLFKGFVKWALRNAWDIILTLTFEIAYFDWNQTDDSIRKQMAANELQIAAQLGQLLGAGSVWLVAISIAGLATFKWPVIAGKVLLDLAEEGGEEIRAELRGVLSATRNAVTRNAVLGTLLAARRLKWFGLEPITEQREPWTIAGAIEERIDNIADDKLRTFVENYIEAGVDALIEVGYVVTYSIEDYYRASKLAQEEVLGRNRGVVLTPDQRIPDERIILTGNQELAKQSIETAIMNHRWVANRDIGQLVGMPLAEYVRGGIRRRNLVVYFRSKEKPPWTALNGEGRIKEVSYTIPDPEINLKWAELKLAARAWNWGKFRCTAHLEDGRQMAVYGATPSDAEDKLRELHSLCTKAIYTVSVSEEKERHPNIRKEATRMYPCYATLTVKRPTNLDRGISDQLGQRYSTETTRIELWPDKEPFDFVNMQ